MMEGKFCTRRSLLYLQLSGTMFYFLVVLIFWFLFDQFYWKRRKLPPGPIAYPLLGNTLSLALNPPGYRPFLDWKRKYGPVFTFWFGSQPTICVTDYKIIKDTIIDDAETFSGRLTLDDLIKIVRGGHYGVVECEGWLWQEQKRFMLSTFRDMGMGKNSMQEKILDEVVSLIASLKGSYGPVEIQKDIDRAVGSIINSLLFGYRYEGERIKEFTKLKECLNQHMRFVMTPLTIMAMMKPLTLGRLPIFKPRLKQLVSNMNELYDYFQIQINEHKQRLESGEELSQEPSDYCDAFLREMERRGGEDQARHSFSEIQLRNMCLDLWTAGLETTTNTITFGIIYFIRHPHVQEKVYQELDSVIGTDRLITANDRSYLPFMNAFISETQRLANLLPLNFSRKTTKDTVINGYFVPKNSSVMPQISCVLFDETIFPEPESFKPERFIDAVTGKYKTIEEFIVFSVGKRSCLGEALARMELFIIISNLFNQFELSPENEGDPPTLEKRFGFALQPHPFRCRVKSRF